MTPAREVEIAADVDKVRRQLLRRFPQEPKLCNALARLLGARLEAAEAEEGEKGTAPLRRRSAPH